jgi:hypothetical protein
MTRARLRKSGSAARSSVRTRVAGLRAMLLSVAKRIVGVKAPVAVAARRNSVRGAVDSWPECPYRYPEHGQRAQDDEGRRRRAGRRALTGVPPFASAGSQTDRGKGYP